LKKPAPRGFASEPEDMTGRVPERTLPLSSARLGPAFESRLTKEHRRLNDD
jgi:hypothetical protein